MNSPGIWQQFLRIVIPRLCFLCYYTQQYCSMYCICNNGIWHNSFCQSHMFLLKSLAYLCPRQCWQEDQLYGQPGPTRKVMSLFLSTIFSTGNIGLHPGAVSTLSILLKLLPLCHWQLALSTMSE